ncbi:MAG: PQQ-dependent sugar dehydrogenase [Kofleriaceae bacterium]
MGPGRQVEGKPVETQPPNATDQEPAFAGQTRAPYHTAGVAFEQPVYYWGPVIAPSGMAFYDGALFPARRGNLFVGGLAGKHLARLVLDGRRVVGEERLLADRLADALSCDYQRCDYPSGDVSQHPPPVQLRAPGHRRGGRGRRAPVRAEGQRHAAAE